MERANLSAAVVLDNTPRKQWRVSSLQGNLLQPSLLQILLGGGRGSRLPVLLVREDDWRPQEDLLRQQGRRIHLGWRSSVSRDLLPRELTCSRGNSISLRRDIQALLYLGAYNRFFLCIEATYPYDFKNQLKARNAPSRGLWMP